MGESSDSHGDERIEELLSNLKTIFNTISKASEPKPEPAHPEPREAASVPVAPPLQTPSPHPETAKVVPQSDDGSIPTLIYYPSGRDAEAVTLGQKLETMTPKFTKVTFQLRIMETLAYDAKFDWQAEAAAKVKTDGIKVFYVILEKPLDPAKREALATELNQTKVYFHEVPLLSIEKKAFYTDQLLGLVFFFDTQKSPEKQE